jgi:hypothetical protein
MRCADGRRGLPAYLVTLPPSAIIVDARWDDVRDAKPDALGMDQGAAASALGTSTYDIIRKTLSY